MPDIYSKQVFYAGLRLPGATNGNVLQVSAQGDIVTVTQASIIASHVNTVGLHIPSGGITNSEVSLSASIAWSKLSKSGAVASDVGALSSANNLSDLANTSTARTNLGAASPYWNANQIQGVSVLSSTISNGQALVFSSANNRYQATTVLVASNNLSDLASANTARSNLGLGSAAVYNVTDFLRSASNLSDLPNPASARTNIGSDTAAWNASKIQGINVSSTAPTNNQALVYNSTNTQYQAVTVLQASNNLSDLANASTARTNLGLGTVATLASTAVLQSANNLSDLASAVTARTNLGLGSAALLASSSLLQSANNLSDLVSVSTARTNLGLGTAALLASTAVLQSANNLSDLANATTARTNIGAGTAAWNANRIQGVNVSSTAPTNNQAQVYDSTNLQYRAVTVLQAANNLSDVGSASTARTNLGLGTAATLASTAVLQSANNLSDLANAVTARTNIGAGTAAWNANKIQDINVSSTAPTNNQALVYNSTNTQYQAVTVLQASNNLSDLASTATARTNLGLGTAATLASTAVLQTANDLSDLASPANARTNIGAGTASWNANKLQGVIVSSTAPTSGQSLIYNSVSLQYDLAVVLQSASNLSDLASPSTARTNLGLGSAATLASTAVLQSSNNLSDLASAVTARTNLGLGSVATLASTAVLQSANNLSDLASPVTARTNLGLGTVATLASTAVLQSANNLSDLGSAATARTNIGAATAAWNASRIQGINVSSTAPTNNQALVYNSTNTQYQAVTVLQASNNLSDVGSVSTARTNLGLGTAATLASTAVLQSANNLSDLASAATARTNLGLGTAATLALTAILQSANNLSDLASAATARTNIGAGTAAWNANKLQGVNVSSTAPTSNQSLIYNSVSLQYDLAVLLQSSNNLSDLANAATARTNLGLGSVATLASTAVLQSANNLSDLPSAATARTNLGLGTAAILASTAVLQSANNLSDLANAATARTNIGAGTAAWNANKLQGVNISSTAPTSNQTLLYNSTTSQYEPAALAANVLGTVLSGLSVTNTTSNITSSDTVLTGLQKLQGQFNNLTGTSTGFLNGGNAYGSAASLGTTTNQHLSLITNGATRLRVFDNGAVNICDGSNTYASSVGLMPTCSLTIGSTAKAMGQAGGWVSANSAGLMLECLRSFFIKYHDSGDSVGEVLSYQNANSIRRIVLGDEANGGVHRVVIKSRDYIEVANTWAYTSASWSNSTTLPPVYVGDQRSVLAIRGRNPFLVLCPDNQNNESQGAVIQMNVLDADSSTIQSWRVAAAPSRNGRVLDLATWSSDTTANPHTNVRYSPGMCVVAPGKSQGNVLGNTYGIGVNNITEPLFNLHVNGSLGIGTYNSYTAEIKVDSNNRLAIDTTSDWDLTLKRNRQERIRLEANSKTVISPVFTSTPGTDGRTYIYGRVIAKSDPNNEGVDTTNYYNDAIGAPNFYIERLEVGSRSNVANDIPAILRFHQYGTGFCEIAKLTDKTLIFRQTPGAGEDTFTPTYNSWVNRARFKNMYLACDSSVIIGSSDSRLNPDKDSTLCLNIYHSSEPSIHMTADNVGGTGAVVKGRVRINDAWFGGERGMFVGTITDHTLNLIRNNDTKLVLKDNQILTRYDGTDAAPSLSSYADPNTGIRWGSNDVIYFSTNGVNRASITNTELQANRFVAATRATVSTLTTLANGSTTQQIIDKVNECVNKINELINVFSANLSSSHSKLLN